MAIDVLREEHPIKAVRREMFWLSNYTDEIVPCDCSLGGWAQWLSQPDADWGREEAARDGETFGATRAIVTYHRAEAHHNDYGWRFAPPLPDNATSFAISYGLGQGWAADEMSDDLDSLKELLDFHQGGIVAALWDDPDTYVVTYRQNPTRCTSAKAN